MPRLIRQDAEAVGSDSFLDVVTNIVGILIILVMVVGIRVKHAPAKPAGPAWDEAQARAEVERLQSEAGSLERDVRKTEEQIQALAATAQGRFQERSTLAYLIAERERELGAARKSLDEKNRHAFDLRRARAKADLDLARVEREAGEAGAIAEKAKKPIQIQSRPTPISHTVFGNEVHFRLLGGRIAYVPIDEIGDLCRQDVESKIHRLNSVDEFSGTMGPIHGFRGLYEVRRIDIGGGASSVYFGVQFAPLAEDLGEPVADALKENSDFRWRLGNFSSRRTTVTLWTYPDSFTDYSTVKEELYQLGFGVAARPMEEGILIGGSTDGTHSSAQ